MEPNTLPQLNQGGASSAPPSLDPSVVALTKAIGKAESGGKYDVGDNAGDNANSYGAYQMTPGFLEEWAPKSGIQYKPGMKLNPAQQDEVAYNAIKTMGTTGDPNHAYLGKLNPAQIASAWNTGDPNAYLDPSYGKNNTYGSTEKYVHEVEKNYNSETGGQKQSNDSIVPTANASESSNSNQSSNSPSWEDYLLGGAAVGGGYLLGLAKQYGAAALTDAGAALGAEAGPVGSVVGATIGSSVGNSLGLNGEKSQTQSSAPQGSVTTPDSSNLIMSEGNQVEPNKVPDQTVQASRQVAQTISQALGTTIGGRKMLQDPNVQAGIEEMGINGFSPEQDENGVMNFKTGIKQAQNSVADLSRAASTMLTAEGSIAPIQNAVEEAKKHIRKTLDPTEWDEAYKQIDASAKSYLKQYGDGQGNMNLGHFQQMKQQMGHGKKYGILESTTKKQADKALALGSRKTIEKHTKNKELYNRVMKKEQRLINAKKIMERLDQKKAPKNDSLFKKLLQSGGKYAALYIGDKIGGPIGAILGSMVGDYASRAADKKFGKTIFETPAFHEGLRILQKEHPHSYQILENELKKAGIGYPQRKTNPVVKRTAKQAEGKLKGVLKPPSR